ncbi:MAG: hypothetical protein R3F60_19710 [bacterium]
MRRRRWTGLLAWARSPPELRSWTPASRRPGPRLRVAEVRGWPKITAGDVDVPAAGPGHKQRRRPGRPDADGGGVGAARADAYSASEEAVEVEAAAADAARAAAQDVALLQVLAAHVQVEDSVAPGEAAGRPSSPLARQALETLESRYAAGGIGFLAVLEAERAGAVRAAARWRPAPRWACGWPRPAAGVAGLPRRRL